MQRGSARVPRIGLIFAANPPIVQLVLVKVAGGGCSGRPGGPTIGAHLRQTADAQKGQLVLQRLGGKRFSAIGRVTEGRFPPSGRQKTRVVLGSGSARVPPWGASKCCAPARSGRPVLSKEI